MRLRRPPGEPPHGQEHTDPGEPRRINLSEELGLTENLTPVVIRKDRTCDIAAYRYDSSPSARLIVSSGPQCAAHACRNAAIFVGVSSSDVIKRTAQTENRADAGGNVATEDVQLSEEARSGAGAATTNRVICCERAAWQ